MRSPRGASTPNGPAVQLLLADVRRGLIEVLGDELVGIYLCGSLTREDFDERISDVDIVVVTDATLDGDQLTALEAMHVTLVRSHASWDDRIEVVCVARDALAARGAATYPTAVISPGEPFHPVRDPPGDDEWLLNWYSLREHSDTLHGPTPEALIAPIGVAEVRTRVRKDLAGWPALIRQSSARHLGWQAYAILTVCRGACMVQTGREVSKSTGAEWAKSVWPDQRRTIDRALGWRREQHLTGYSSDEEAYPETVAFIDHVAASVDDH
jgi:predicted nucleotidyltransferase